MSIKNTVIKAKNAKLILACEQSKVCELENFCALPFSFFPTY